MSAEDLQELLESDCYEAHNRYFESFTPRWRQALQEEHFKEAERLWDCALGKVYEFECQHGKKIHKGTAYYFWGVTCILNDELEKGFLLMHQALEEDIETAGGENRDSPAYCFVTLDYEKQDQAFRQKIKELAKFVDDRINNYRNARSTALTLSDFKSKFLGEHNLQAVVFLFVFQLFHLKKVLTEIDKRLTQNTFSSLLLARAIFSICLVIDNALQEKTKQRYFRNHLEFLSKKSLLSFDTNMLTEINKAFDSSFSNTLKELLDSQYQFSDGTMPTRIEEDFAIAYSLRNFGAHRIEDQSIVYRRFQQISQRLLNTLFFSIEKLY